MIDDLIYRPTADALAWLTERKPRRILLLGAPSAATVPTLEELPTDIREADASTIPNGLHDGIYAAFRRGDWEALLVSAGYSQAEPASARRRFTDDGPRLHLSHAWDVLVEGWEHARPFVGLSAFAVDDVVSIRGNDRIGRVRRVVRRPSGYEIEVMIDGESVSFSESSLVKIDGDPRDPEFWLTQPPGRAHDIALTLTWTKLRHPLSDTLYSFAASKTLFRAYQFIPALKILASTTGRLLIADEVGLGKTIEAGIVWSELEQRHTLRRTLVVAPSSLTLKWQIEMSRRFDRRLDRIKPPRLGELADELRAGNDPELHAIISLESLRSATDVLQALNEIKPRFDLVIVDEAHALRNVGRRSNILGVLLSDWSDHLLFLSATPINLRSDDLYNLLNLLDEGMYSDPTVFHLQLEPNAHLNAIAHDVAIGMPGSAVQHHLAAIRTLTMGRSLVTRTEFERLGQLLTTSEPLSYDERSEVKRLIAELNTLSAVLSRTRKVDVPDAKAVREPHPIEVTWSSAEKDFYDAVFAHVMAKAMKSGTPPGFASQMPLRQAASCLPAMQRLLRQRDPALFWSQVDDADEETTDESETDWSEIPVLARPLGTDTKFEALRSRLLELRSTGIRQSMIFSTFRGTIAYLHERLSIDFSVGVLHGGVPMDSRQPIIDDFRAGAFEVLLASEVGSEGLDFEFCNVLVNYDLPWNPMRVEQRIGRLDRFGQKHEKIFILNMHVPGTIETDILERLYTRIGIFKNSIGDLEPILREEFRDVPRLILDPSLDAQQRTARADEIEVAIRTRAATLETLEQSRATLSTIDQLRVEGMEESGPADGRYVGAAEVQMLIGTLARITGASLSGPDGRGAYRLKGTPELADRLWELRRDGNGTKFSVTALQGVLDRGEPLEVTFDAELASQHDVELLSVRHPLVRLALRVLEKDRLQLRRYGRVSVPGAPAGRYLVQVDLVTATGVRPTREMWATAIDVDTGEVVDEVGRQVLVALAEGRLSDAASSSDVSHMLVPLRDAVWSRRQAAEVQRRRANDSMVTARLDSRRQSITMKIDKVSGTLKQVLAAERDARVIRLHEGRLRNLREELHEAEVTLGQQRELAMEIQTVAVLDVIGV